MSDHSYLNVNKKNAFSPPVPERLLKKKSAKLVFSSRLFPAWVATAYGALKHKYPDLEPNSASELIALVFQDYCNIFLEETNGTLAPSRDSLDFLISRGFVSSQGERKHKGISKVQKMINKFEATNPDRLSFEEQFNYYTELYGREKADEIMAEKIDLNFEEEEISDQEREKLRKEVKRELKGTGFEAESEEEKKAVKPLDFEKYANNKEDSVVRTTTDKWDREEKRRKEEEREKKKEIGYVSHPNIAHKDIKKRAEERQEKEKEELGWNLEKLLSEEEKEE